MEFVNEKRVLDFYVEEIDNNTIEFLKNRPKYSEQIKKFILDLREETEMHNKITICKGLWKILFEASMSFMDSDRRGYDDLFNYFDEYVDFEELIFASDSFYRDHTMHCLWVYFLGEYIIKNDEFKIFFGEYAEGVKMFGEITNAIKKNDLAEEFHGFIQLTDMMIESQRYNDSIRCLGALTHDLGYPIKKINAINKNIRRILPHFGIKNFTEFGFNYSDVHDNLIKDFLNFISYRFNYTTNYRGKGDERASSHIAQNIFKLDEYGGVEGINEKELAKITDEEKQILKGTDFVKDMYLDYSKHMRYSKDFENYQHGIMSAFLLYRKLAIFNSGSISWKDFNNIRATDSDYLRMNILSDVLSQITDHTSEGYQITQLDENSFLTFIDELEEFSRISRANKSREYINEFCKSSIYMEDEYLRIDFIFDNTKIDNLDPERAFKGRCKRFLTLFNIKELDEKFKLKLRCIGKLPYDNNVYMLELRKKFATITINDEEKDIQKYLKSKEFLTKEEYAQL